jgi:uncharacterized membrane protein YhaH (DUF805 family)
MAGRIAGMRAGDTICCCFAKGIGLPPVHFQGAAMDPFQLFFGFSGRINRAKFWLALVINIVAWLIVGGIVLSATLGFVALFFILFFVVATPFLISGVAIGVKRLHDRDKSGWWLLVFYLLPAVLNSMAEAAGTGLQFVFALAAFAISIWGFVELGCLRGTAGPNKFGSDPLAT